MTLIRLDDTIADIKGKVGGVSYKSDRSGKHQISQPYINHQASDSQRLQRQRFQKACKFCAHDTDAIKFIDAWLDYASQHPAKNKLGEKIILSSFDTCIRHNINRQIAGLSMQPAPPSFCSEIESGCYTTNSSAIIVYLTFTRPMNSDKKPAQTSIFIEIDGITKNPYRIGNWAENIEYSFPVKATPPITTVNVTVVKDVDLQSQSGVPVGLFTLNDIPLCP